MAEINNIKQLDGQPWSSWRKLCENFSTGEEVPRKYDISHCLKLNRKDMPLYGLCPKTEVFELVVCKFCGLKYKLPAFAEHISLRHCGDKKIIASSLDRPDIPKKGKLKRPKEKFNFQTDTVTLKVDMKMKIDFLKIVSDRKSLTIDTGTISKIKQLHFNARASNKSSENDNHSKEEDVSKTGSCNVNDFNLNNEIINQKFVDSNVKTYDVSSSPLPQDGEKINMQPIVKLSPISSNPHMPNSYNDSSESNKSGSSPEIKKRFVTYSSDPQCGLLVDNEARKFVSGRSKLNRVLISNSAVDSANTFQRKNMEEDSCEVVSVAQNVSAQSDNNNATFYNCEVNCKKIPVAVSTSESTEENRKVCDSVSEDNAVTSRSIKRNTNDLQGLSLPVSIKNPTILCQLQNIKSKFYIPVKAARCSNIQDLLKHNLGLKHLMVPPNSQAFKENTESVLIELEGPEKTPPVKASELKPEWFQQWHPGYRRVGGLLYANHNVTGVRRRTFITTMSTFSSHEEHYNPFLQPKLNAIKDKNEIIDLSDSDSSKTEFKRMKFEISPGNNKKSINSLISKQKNNFIVSSNVSKSPLPQKVHFSQSTNKAFICKRTSSNINGTLSAKVKRQEGTINIISPVFGKINKNCP